ncbi:MAG: ATPase [Sneathiella sp.]|jgi:chaperone required for assembly of F1-ATPase|uniref:ATP12 family chaperone protein n=1 Tax=Sneathiella sp. TaxID=1964365 RepID=UPI000C56DED9|nr:ATP12 family protein [Sneathiella sp.]MAL79810.1 ATPase [Sneathiella sp.]
MKRFYKEVTAEERDGGFCVLLDGRMIKTPAKAGLHLPTRALAEAIAAEWDAQGAELVPASMPLMQAAATVIDRVTTQREKVIDDIAAYGGSDLVCYRATHPEGLVARQRAAWDPMLDWLKNRHGVTLHVAEGVMHIPQPPQSLSALRAVVAAQGDMALAPLYNMTSLCGSLVIALAVLDGHLSADQAFEISELDETHVMEHWGADAEAVKRRENNKESLAASARFLTLI